MLWILVLSQSSTRLLYLQYFASAVLVLPNFRSFWCFSTLKSRLLFLLPACICSHGYLSSGIFVSYASVLFLVSGASRSLVIILLVLLALRLILKLCFLMMLWILFGSMGSYAMDSTHFHAICFMLCWSPLLVEFNLLIILLTILSWWPWFFCYFAYQSKFFA